MPRPSEEELMKKWCELVSTIAVPVHADVSRELANWACDQMEQPASVDGVMSFEEWHMSYYGRAHSQNKELIEMVWDKARIGMIPAANAINIPEVWPLDCAVRGIKVAYTYEGDACSPLQIAYIPRPTPPKPKWEPKDWEPVFYLDGYPRVGAAKEIGGEITIKRTDGGYEELPPSVVKQFDATKIGKPWDEI
jgi:hypothetical protein